jgi:hypothetical protein
LQRRLAGGVSYTHTSSISSGVAAAKRSHETTPIYEGVVFWGSPALMYTVHIYRESEWNFSIEGGQQLARLKPRLDSIFSRISGI